MVDARRQRSLKLLKPLVAPPRNAGAEARNEYEGALEKWKF